MAINSYPDNSGGEVQFPDQLIDPVSKFRVSNPENLIDTDFEYGLQPTKWETVELINNTPSFFSKSGDTTIDGISSIITNAGTREIIVKTELDHGLAVGIPINVTGTKSITADGAYIINSIPDPKTFTYLCKDNQTDTNSILDLYSSIITGEFFQGSQLRISDSDGIVTDAAGTSLLTVTTNTTHGFGENTPFYFLNLNSTVAQEFQAANTASKSFDASNSATAQTFDGSNSLSSVNIDWSNSATFGGTPSTISGTDQAADTITVTHQAGENFNNLPLGTPLYYAVSATGGYFNTNPRGVVFIKSIGQLGTLTSTFQVSLVPDGDVIDLTSNLTGTFQIANQARTFAGNNINPLTQTVVNIEVGPTFNFDGGNQGYTGAVQGTPPNNALTVLSYTGTEINADGASSVDYYVGAMVLYTTSGTAPTGLATNTTYFVTSFTNNSGGNYTLSVAALPGGTPISFTGSGSGTQVFSRIGVSIDRDIVHIPNSNFLKDDMIEYSFPVDGRFDVSDPEQEKSFYFVDAAFDAHNYRLTESLGDRPIEATGGTILPDFVDQGRTWRAHQFTTVGTNTLNIINPGDGYLEYLIVAGGGSGGSRHAGGGGGGGVLVGSTTVSSGPYTIVVGAGGAGPVGNVIGNNGSNSTAFGFTAIGGGRGAQYNNDNIGIAAGSGGSGGGGAGGQSGSHVGGAGTSGQGFAGGTGVTTNPPISAAGGGGAGEAGQSASGVLAGRGGNGRLVKILGTNLYFGGGGGGAIYYANETAGRGGLGGGGGGAANFGFAGAGGTNGLNPGGAGNAAGNANTNANGNGGDGGANTGGGGGGAAQNAPGWTTRGGAGGSGIVIVRYPITPAVDFVAANATGGVTSTVVEGGITYRAHSFTSTGTSTFQVTNVGSWNEFEYLIVAGGGGGGGSHGGGGGGAGGVLQGKTSLLTQSYTLTVGAGGSGGVNALGTNGGNSSGLGLTAIGGGRGASEQSGETANSGGSGGGGSGAGNTTAVNRNPGAGTAGQGFSGGTGSGGAGTTTYGSGAGGGGAGASGSNGFGSDQNTGFGGRGGDGILSKILGTDLFVGGGGAGGSWSGTRAFGGLGGGGNGAVDGEITASSGLPNTGGGGGGSAGSTGGNRIGGAGGSGRIIIRYPIAVA
jgi:hypothetical protein